VGSHCVHKDTKKSLEKIDKKLYIEIKSICTGVCDSSNVMMGHL